MKHPNRQRKLIIACAILVIILSLITFIGSILFLEPIIRGSYSRPGRQLNLLETVVVNLRHCIWMGLLLAPIVGWRYAQAKLSCRLAVSILSVIAIVELCYLLLDLIAFAVSGPPGIIGGGY